MAKRIKEITKSRWIELYTQGISVSEISKRSGVSVLPVYKHLREKGCLKPRARQITITTKMIKEWVNLYETGSVNCMWIARKYNASRETIVKYLHMAGVQTSRKVPHIVEER